MKLIRNCDSFKRLQQTLKKNENVENPNDIIYKYYSMDSKLYSMDSKLYT